MQEYRVVWEIDVYADSPADAARKARAYQLKADADVGAFTINGQEIDLCPNCERDRNDESLSMVGGFDHCICED